MKDNSCLSIGVIGIRDFKNAIYSNAEYIAETLKEFIASAVAKHGDKPVEIITGGGRGVEDLVVKFCEENGIRVKKVPPNIRHFGATKAFTIRNNTIVVTSDELLVYWDSCTPLMVEAITTATKIRSRVTILPVI